MNEDLDAAVRTVAAIPTWPACGGAGLGLFIGAEIARSHGGTLTYRSDVAETRFTFRVPLAQYTTSAATP